MSERHHVKIDGNALRALLTDPSRVGRADPDFMFCWINELFKGVLQSGIPIKDWIPTILGNKVWDQRDPQSRAIQEALRNAHEMYSRTRKAPAYLPRNQNIRNNWGPLNAAGDPITNMTNDAYIANAFDMDAEPEKYKQVRSEIVTY